MYNNHNVSDTRAKRHNGIRYGFNITWKADSQCMLQDVWVHKYVTGYFISQ